MKIDCSISGYAIKCHQCNSHTDPECAKYDDMGEYQGQNTLKECAGGEKYCRKILQVGKIIVA